jgi:hypothetical protein
MNIDSTTLTQLNHKIAKYQAKTRQYQQLAKKMGGQRGGGRFEKEYIEVSTSGGPGYYMKPFKHDHIVLRVVSNQSGLTKRPKYEYVVLTVLDVFTKGDRIDIDTQFVKCRYSFRTHSKEMELNLVDLLSNDLMFDGKRTAGILILEEKFQTIGSHKSMKINSTRKIDNDNSEKIIQLFRCLDADMMPIEEIVIGLVDLHINPTNAPCYFVDLTQNNDFSDIHEDAPQRLGFSNCAEIQRNILDSMNVYRTKSQPKSEEILNPGTTWNWNDYFQNRDYLIKSKSEHFSK